MVVMLLLCVSGIVYIIQPQPTALAAADPMRQAIEESLPAIRRVLEQQGLAERLTIGRRGPFHHHHGLAARRGRAGTGGHGHGAGLAHAGAAPEQ